MGDKKKNTVFRVFQAAQCGSAKYVLGVLCSAVSILCTAVPFYTVYRIVRIFLEASLHQTSVDSSQAWFWVGMTLASIAAGILLSIAGSVICHACAFRALYDLRMRILGHMGKLNLGFFTGGQSGGETQRIAIARAILKDAPIVVLDEAMAFADAENELALREGMAELLQGKTVLMIAHRLYSIRDADCIYVLDSGRLAESGTHQELLDKNGLYAHLWAIQNETEVWQMKGGVSPA